MRNEINRKVKAIVVAAMIGIFAIAAMACGGNSIEGKWYDVKSASEAGYDNMEFSSDGTVTCEGVSGKYEMDGGKVKANIYGTDFTCEFEKYKGYDVLYSSWTGSYYTKDLDDAKEVQKLLKKEK